MSKRLKSDSSIIEGMLKDSPACCVGCWLSSIICVGMMDADTLTVSEDVAASSGWIVLRLPLPLAGEVLCLWTCLLDNLDCLKRTGGMMITDFFQIFSEVDFNKGFTLAGTRKRKLRNLIVCTKNYLYFLCMFGSWYQVYSPCDSLYNCI